MVHAAEPVVVAVDPGQRAGPVGALAHRDEALPGVVEQEGAQPEAAPARDADRHEPRPGRVERDDLGDGAVSELELPREGERVLRVVVEPALDGEGDADDGEPEDDEEGDPRPDRATLHATEFSSTPLEEELVGSPQDEPEAEARRLVVPGQDVGLGLPEAVPELETALDRDERVAVAQEQEDARRLDVTGDEHGVGPELAREGGRQVAGRDAAGLPGLAVVADRVLGARRDEVREVAAGEDEGRPVDARLEGDQDRPEDPPAEIPR